MVGSYKSSIPYYCFNDQYNSGFYRDGNNLKSFAIYSGEKRSTERTDSLVAENVFTDTQYKPFRIVEYVSVSSQHYSQNERRCIVYGVPLQAPTIIANNTNDIQLDEKSEYKPSFTIVDRNGDDYTYSVLVDGKFLVQGKRDTGVNIPVIKGVAFNTGVHSIEVIATDITGRSNKVKQLFEVKLPDAQIPELIQTDVTDESYKFKIIDQNRTDYKYCIQINGQYLDESGAIQRDIKWMLIPSKEVEVKGLSPNTTYTVQIKAIGLFGPEPPESNYSIPLVVKTISRQTQSPQNFRTAKIDSSSVDLEWDGVAGASSYVLEQDGVVIKSMLYESKCKVSGLIQGKEYKFRVWAKTEDDVQSKKSELTVRTHALNLKAPKGLKVSETMPSSFKVSWQGVAGASGYDIERNGVIEVTDSPETAYVFENQGQNEKSTIRVRGVTEQGAGAWSEPITGYTTVALGDIVQTAGSAGSAQSIRSNQIIMNWQPIAGAMAYQLEADGEKVYEGKDPIYIHKGLKPESQHSYRVRVKNLGGWGPWSNTLALMTSNGIPTSAPQGIETSASDEGITLTWKPLDEAESYEVVEVVGGKETQVIDNGKGTTCQKKGLKPGSSHTYRVRGKNTVGEGPWSSDIIATTFTEATPVLMNSIESDTKIAVEWSHSEDLATSFSTKIGKTPWDRTNVTTGSAITYEVSINGTSVGTTTNTYYIASGLSPETKYMLRVRMVDPAVPSKGISQWSEEMPVFTTPIRPDMPKNVNATVGDETITITWDGVENAEGYDIELDGVLLENDGENQYIHEGLMPFTLHKYRVRARNGAVEGDWSDLKSIKTLPSYPVAPKEIDIRSYATGAELKWENIPGARGYDLEITEGANVTLIEKLGKPYFNHRKIKEGTESRYRIRTRNVQGISDWSGTIINNAIRAICLKDNTLDLGLTAHDVVDFSKYTMTVTYNPDVVDVEDLSTITGEKELAHGRIEGTDVTIVSFERGKIIFKCDKAVESDESWTGVINSIKFKSKYKGGTTITYTVLTQTKDQLIDGGRK